MNNLVYSQISYNSCISNPFKWKLRYNLQLWLVEMKTAIGKDIAEHGSGPAMVITASLVAVTRCSTAIRTTWTFEGFNDNQRV
jgi:hypothetical protein